ncbi:MAG: DUF2157 domain-containing protein [Bryobacteraceae bacterium]
MNKSDAQRRADRIRAFREELRELEGEGALELTAEQRGRLDAHLESLLGGLAERYDVDVTDAAKRISWGMRIASTIAGLALCAAVVLFFYRIWDRLPLPAQIAVLVLTPAAAVAAMEFASRRERTYYYTALLGIIAFAAAVFNLNALGGMFNMTPSPNAFLVWAAFGLALAYAYRLKLLLAAGIMCGMFFIAMTLMSWTGLFWAAVDARVETVIAAGGLGIAVPSIFRHRTLEEFRWVYRYTGLCAVLLALFVLSLNGRSSFLALEPRTVEIVAQLAGMAAAALAIWRGVLARSPSIVNTAAAFFAVYLYTRLFQWWWDWMPKYLFFLIIGAISLALLYCFQRMRRRA